MPAFAFLRLAALSVFLLACDALDKPTISLYLAVQRGDIDQLERHIHWGADINAPFSNGRYPMHEAADKGRTILLQHLLSHQATLNVQDQYGKSPIDLAILAGRIQAAQILRQAGAEFDASRLLLLVAEQQTTDRDIVHFLVEQGGNLESTDADGRTPLLIAVGQGNHRLVGYLIQLGADVDARDAQGVSALQIARMKNLQQIEQRLLRYGANGELN